MHSVVQEMLRMGLWQKLFSHPLRYVYYLAGYVSPQRLCSASPPFRHAPKPLECNQCALDIILNEQEPFHPSNAFFNSAIGHTRSFSTSVADRARRFPERNKAKDNQGNKSLRTPARNKSFSGVLKRSRSDENLQRRNESRRMLKKKSKDDEKPSTDTQTFSSKMLTATSSPMVTGRRWSNPQATVVPSLKESDTNYSSKSAHLFRNRFNLPEQAEELRQKLALPIGTRAKKIKHRLWDTWIVREPVQGRLPGMQFLGVVTGTDAEEQIGVCGA